MKRNPRICYGMFLVRWTPLENRKKIPTSLTLTLPLLYILDQVHPVHLTSCLAYYLLPKYSGWLQGTLRGKTVLLLCQHCFNMTRLKTRCDLISDLLAFKKVKFYNLQISKCINISTTYLWKFVACRNVPGCATK